MPGDSAQSTRALHGQFAILKTAVRAIFQGQTDNGMIPELNRVLYRTYKPLA